MMLGAVYLTGALFFGTVLFARHWRQVRIGFLPVTAFATLMGIATLLHWDKFNHDHPAFWLWAFLYAVTPFLIPLVWLRNQAVAPGPQTKEDKRFPIAVMTLIGMVGFSGLLAGSLLFLSPGLNTYLALELDAADC